MILIRAEIAPELRHKKRLLDRIIVKPHKAAIGGRSIPQPLGVAQLIVILTEVNQRGAGLELVCRTVLKLQDAAIAID